MSDPTDIRYCPMCNRRTFVAAELVEPFMVRTCAECGHVHSVREVFQMPPIMLIAGLLGRQP